VGSADAGVSQGHTFVIISVG